MLAFLTRALLVHQKPSPLRRSTANVKWPLYRQYATKPYKLDPALVYFRKLDDKNAVQIQLNYIEPEYRVNRVFTFERQLDEPIEKSIERMQEKMETYLVKKLFGRKQTTDGSKHTLSGQFELALVNAVRDRVEGISWNDFLAQPVDHLSSCALRVRDKEFGLMVNNPYVSGAKIQNSIIVGYDCYPTKMELQNTSRDECTYRWFKGLPRPTNPKDVNAIKWIECGNEFCYRVQPDDVHHKFKLEITPHRDGLVGPKIDVFSDHTAVTHVNDDFDAFRERHLLTQALPAADRAFRVISYNLLADFYANSDYSRTELFPYCPPYALNIEYRKQLMAREIRGYNGDIICLQEVDKATFDSDFEWLFGSDGYKGAFMRKGMLPEGLATFYNANKFSLLRTFEFDLGKGIAHEPSGSYLFNLIQDNHKLCERMLALPSSLQVTLLKSKAHNEYVLVANTHLYSQMDAAHIRLLQIAFSMMYITGVRWRVLKELDIGEEQLSLVFCGDMNSVPERGVRQFMLDKRIDSDHIDFKSNEEQAVTNVSLEHDFNMGSAYDSSIHTNYTHHFVGCLDYIFYDVDNLQLQQAIPMHSEEFLCANVAIPSIHFPSDHLALVADFQWRDSRQK